MILVWWIFTAFVVTSYVTLLRYWMLHPIRWHVGAMASAFTILCVAVSLLFYHHKIEIKPITSLLLVLVVGFGGIGLGVYHVDSLRWHWLFFMLRQARKLDK